MLTSGYLVNEPKSIRHWCYIDNANPDTFLVSTDHELYLVHESDGETKYVHKFSCNGYHTNLVPRLNGKQIMVQYSNCGVGFIHCDILNQINTCGESYMPMRDQEIIDHTGQVQWFQSHTLAYNNYSDLLIYDINKSLSLFQGHLNMGTATIPITTDHKSCIFTAEGGIVRCWDIREKRNPTKIESDPGKQLYNSSLCLSHDGNYLTMGGHNGIRITDVRTNKPFRYIPLPNYFVTGIAYNSSETCMAAICYTKTTGHKGLLTVNLKPGIQIVHTPLNDIASVVFEPLDKRIMIGREKGKFSSIESPDWPDVARNLLNDSDVFNRHSLSEQHLISSIVDFLK